MSKTSTEKTVVRSAALVRRAVNGPAMGARWSAIFFAPVGFDESRLAAALAAAIEEVEAQMSSWRSTSDLARLNRAPIGVWVDLPAGLFEVLEAALEIGRQSDGAFDVGVGDLVGAFGFGGGSHTPDAARIAATIGRPSFEPPKTLELDRTNRRARRLAPMTVDLSGIAKGYGVDRMAAVMGDFAVASFLVGIDGEMRAGGRKPDGSAWVVGQERPDRGARDLLGVIELTQAAVATSGTYRHVAEIGGRTVSHTMDPATGRPLEGDLAQVTVVAESCMLADAWATALLVARLDAGLALARRRGLTAFLVDTAGRSHAVSADA